MGTRFALIGICAAALCSMAVSTASAEVVNRYVYAAQYPEASFNGSDAVGASSFGEPTNLAINQTTEDVYVGSNGLIYHLNAAGVSQPFTSVAPNTVISQGTNALGALKVDNSGTSTNGRIFAMEGGSPLHGFLPSGAAIGEQFPIQNQGAFCGMEVAPDGGIWLANYFQGISRYNPSGVSSEESISTPSPCGFAIDSQENFYVPGSFYSPGQSGTTIKKYNRDGELLDSKWGGKNLGGENIAIDRSNDHVFVALGDHVNEFDSSGAFVSGFGTAKENESKSYPGLSGAEGIAVNETTHKVYVGNTSGSHTVDTFMRAGPTTIPTVSTERPSTTVTSAVFKGTIDPDLVNGGGPVTNCAFEWGTQPVYEYSGFEYNEVYTYDHVAPCDQAMPAGAATQVTATITGLVEGRAYHFRMIANSANKVQAFTEDRVFRASEPVVISDEFTSEVFSDGAKFNATVDPRASTTTYHFEFGTEPCSGGACAALPERLIEEHLAVFPIREATQVLSGLDPDTTYYWRIVTENETGPVVGPDHSFTTFALDEATEDGCGNALVRKQTGAAHLADCRAYELVSAADTGGYDVASSLAPGQEPLPGYPDAINPPRALYTVHYGAIPGVGDAPNFGGDPYVATRGVNGWTTKYVGLPVAGTPDPDDFSSALLGADAGLDTFAFGGPNICDPCFADGRTGIPLRRPTGQLIQGMEGSMSPAAPEAAGEIRQPFSADGGHLVFGSTEQLEPAGNSGGLSIYDRALGGGGTQVVSTLPDGATMSGEVAELGISGDGSRIVIGRVVGTDDAGNELYDLFMHRGTDPSSVLIADTPHGVTYGGMSADGGTVYFSTVDPVSGDSDSSADLYRAKIGSGPAEVTRLSTGAASTGDLDSCAPTSDWNDVIGAPDCSVLMVSGAGGVAGQSESVAFLSPELLDGGSNGIVGEPNLYLVVGDGSPVFVATLTVDDSLVLDAGTDAARRHTADFQITPSGRFAVFASRRPITGYPTNGHQEIYRYDADGHEVACASCAPTGARAENDASLPEAGGAISDDGRVFFTSPDQLNLRDLNGKNDVYQSSAEGVKIVTTGISEFDSALLSASRDGKDVYFFTHDVLFAGDENGNLVKVYDARQGGGFYVPQTLPPCRASDECHGPSSESPPPPDIGTYKGIGGQVTPETATKPKRCTRRQVRRHGRCVKKPTANRRTKKQGGARG